MWPAASAAWPPSAARRTRTPRSWSRSASCVDYRRATSPARASAPCVGPVNDHRALPWTDGGVVQMLSPSVVQCRVAKTMTGRRRPESRNPAVCGASTYAPKRTRTSTRLSRTRPSTLPVKRSDGAGPRCRAIPRPAGGRLGPYLTPDECHGECHATGGLRRYLPAAPAGSPGRLSGRHAGPRGVRAMVADGLGRVAVRRVATSSDPRPR